MLTAFYILPYLRFGVKNYTFRVQEASLLSQYGGEDGCQEFLCRIVKTSSFCGIIFPTTWLIYKPKIEAITGELASPWKVRDAFLGAGLYLKAFGADTKSYTKEIGAVTAYLCGTSYMTTRCKQAGGYWYRSSVMKNADQWEDWIDEGLF